MRAGESAQGTSDKLSPQGGCATFLCQPLDVLKTRLMNSKGEYQVKTGFHAPGLGGFPPSIAWGPPHSQPCGLSSPRDRCVPHWSTGAQKQGSCPLFLSSCSTLGSTCLGVGLYFSKALALVFTEEAVHTICRVYLASV